VRARREDGVEQTKLAIELDRRAEEPIELSPPMRNRVVQLMAMALLAAHGAKCTGKEEVDDDARD
jgi:hypothetical protein